MTAAVESRLPATAKLDRVAGRRVAQLRFDVFVQVVGNRVVGRGEPFPIPADDQIAPALRSQLDWNLPGAEEIPPGARLLFLSAWVSLYGLVTMDVFGHLGWALKDSAPFFEYELEQLCTKLGIAYAPPTEEL